MSNIILQIDKVFLQQCATSAAKNFDKSKAASAALFSPPFNAALPGAEDLRTRVSELRACHYLRARRRKAVFLSLLGLLHSSQSYVYQVLLAEVGELGHTPGDLRVD